MADKDSTSNRTTPKVCKAAKATRKAHLRNKSRINPKVIASIVFINPETRKIRALSDWETAFKSYVNALSSDEQTIVRKCLIFTCAKPENREYLHGKCPVILFSTIRK
ncbi:MAG: hypothetical protein JSR32_10700 [Proteobacteria bacterium]|nr:hypothetical protein [Pseudomonadota bacterium]